MILYIIVVFISVVIISVVDALSYHFTIVKKHSTQAIIWGAISWFCSCIILLYILRSDYPVLYIFIGSLSSAIGNLYSIKIINKYKKIIKNVKRIFKRKKRKNNTKM